MSTWALIGVIAVATYLLRVTGPLLMRREVPVNLDKVLRYLAPAVLGGQIATGMFSSGRSWELDERFLGFVTAGVAVLLRAPPLVIIIGAAIVTASARAVA
jgi:uncharacterized membrane protein